jgi:hypothetical protein
VSGNPKIAVIEHRRALAECEGKRELAAGSYETLKQSVEVIAPVARTGGSI